MISASALSPSARLCHLLLCSLLSVLCSALLHAQEADGEALGSVARAQFSSSVIDREPRDNLISASSDLEKLYFFSELRDMGGKTIIHRWRYFDEIVTEIEFEVKGPRWRVFSYKSMQQSLYGEWSVELLDETGHSYGEHAILVEKGSAASPSSGVQDSIAGSSADTSSVIPRTEADAHAADSVVNAVKMVFPDGQYTLVNDTLASGNCPPGGRFQWQSLSATLWALDMAGQVHMRVHHGVKQRELIPDPQLDQPGSDCLIYSAHRFDPDQSELLTELQADCEGQARDIFSVRSLKRRGDLVDLTIYDDDFAVCRYRLN